MKTVRGAFRAGTVRRNLRGGRAVLAELSSGWAEEAFRPSTATHGASPSAVPGCWVQDVRTRLAAPMDQRTRITVMDQLQLVPDGRRRAIAEMSRISITPLPSMSAVLTKPG